MTLVYATTGDPLYGTQGKVVRKGKSGGLDAYGSSVGRAIHKVPPRQMQLSTKMRAILRVALNMTLLV